MQALHTYFFSTRNYPERVAWFKKALYVFVIIKCVYWVFYFPLFFGAHALIYTSPFHIGFFKSLAFLLYNWHSPTLSALALAVSVLVCIYQLSFNSGVLHVLSQPFVPLNKKVHREDEHTGLNYKKHWFKRVHFFPDFILWFCVINLHNQIYPALSGGDYLLNQLLFFNILLYSNSLSATTLIGQLKIALHNTGIVALWLQLCVAYLLSGLSKTTSNAWLQGEAVFLTSQAIHFSLWGLQNIPPWCKGLFFLLNYFVLFYQLSFPILIWIKKIRKPFLLIGVGIHLYIALVMGLPWFAITMILGYIIFWPFVAFNKKSKTNF